MSRPFRFIPDEYKNSTDSYGRDIAVVEITIRTVLRMFLLNPTPQNWSIIVGAMAHGPLLLDLTTAASDCPPGTVPAAKP